MSQNIFQALREDHDKQRTLVDLLTKTNGDSEGRRELFDKLKVELESHSAAEERYFYRPLMEHDNTLPRARHSIAEHNKIDELLEDLEKTDLSSPGWLATAKKLKEEVIHHLDEEEQEVFKSAGHAMNEKQKETLAGSFVKEKEEQVEQRK